MCSERQNRPTEPLERSNYRLLLQLAASRQPEPPAPLDWLAYKNVKNLDKWRIKWAMR